MKKKNWYKGLTATAVTLAMAGAVLSVPAFAEDSGNLEEQQIDVQNAAEQAAFTLSGSVEWGEPSSDKDPIHSTGSDGSQITETTETTEGTVVDEDKEEIGKVTKEEDTTVTVKPPVYDSDNATTVVTDTTPNPDGSTTVETETTTPGKQETVTEVDGNVTGDTTVTDTETDDKEEIEDGLLGDGNDDLDDVLEDVEADKNATNKVTINGEEWNYSVSADSEGGEKKYTFTHTTPGNNIDIGDLTNQQIVDILGDGYTIGEDGQIYTADGHKAAVTISGNTVTVAEETTEIEVSVKDDEEVDFGESGILGDDGKVNHQITTDESGNHLYNGEIVEDYNETDNAITFKQGDKTYILTKGDVVTGSLTDDEIFALLGGAAAGYEMDADGNITKDGYTVDKGSLTFINTGLDSEEETVTDETTGSLTDSADNGYVYVDEDNIKHILSGDEVTVNEDGSYTFTIDGKTYTVTKDQITVEKPDDDATGVYEDNCWNDFFEGTIFENGGFKDTEDLRDFIDNGKYNNQCGIDYTYESKEENGVKTETLIAHSPTGVFGIKYTITTENYTKEQICDLLGEGYKIEGDNIVDANGNIVDYSGMVTKTTVTAEKLTNWADGGCIENGSISVDSPEFEKDEELQIDKDYANVKDIIEGLFKGQEGTWDHWNQKYTITNGDTIIVVSGDIDLSVCNGYDYVITVDTTNRVTVTGDALDNDVNQGIKDDADRFLGHHGNIDDVTKVVETKTETQIVFVKRDEEWNKKIWWPGCGWDKEVTYTISDVKDCGSHTTIHVEGTTGCEIGTETTYSGDINAFVTDVTSVKVTEDVANGIALIGGVEYIPIYVTKTVTTVYDYSFDYEYEYTDVEDVEKVEDGSYVIPPETELPELEPDDGSSTVIDDDDVPLVPGDDTENDTGDYEEIDDDDTPLTDGPTDDEIDDIIAEIEEEVTPLTSVPQTGVPADNDMNGAAAAGAAGIAALAAAVLFRKARRSR